MAKDTGEDRIERTGRKIYKLLLVYIRKISFDSVVYGGVAIKQILYRSYCTLSYKKESNTVQLIETSRVANSRGLFREREGVYSLLLLVCSFV